MTREEFIDQYGNYWDLREYAENNGCTYDVFDGDYDDIIDDYTYRDWVKDDVDYWFGENGGFDELARYIEDLPEEYDGGLYIRYGYFDYSEISEARIDEYINNAIEWAEENGYIGDDEDEEDTDSDAVENSGYRSDECFIDEPEKKDDEINISDFFGEIGLIVIE